MLERSVNEFLDKLSSKEPVPGGGSVSALLGALCCALGNMVCSLTIGKKKYSSYDIQNQQIAVKLEQIKDDFKVLYCADIRAFEDLVVTYKLPSETKEQQIYKANTMKPLLLKAIDVPMCIMKNCILALECMDGLKDHASVLVISDIGVAVSCAKACLESAILNIFINTSSLDEKQQAKEINQQANELLDKGIWLADKIYIDISSCLQK